MRDRDRLGRWGGAPRPLTEREGECVRAHRAECGGRMALANWRGMTVRAGVSGRVRHVVLERDVWVLDCPVCGLFAETPDLVAACAVPA